MGYVKSGMPEASKASYYDVVDEQLQVRGYSPGVISATGAAIDHLKAKARTEEQDQDLFLIRQYREEWKRLGGDPNTLSKAFVEVETLRKRNAELIKSLGESKEYIADIRDACVVAFAMDYDADPLEFLRQDDESDECEIEGDEFAGTIFQDCNVVINMG